MNLTHLDCLQTCSFPCFVSLYLKSERLVKFTHKSYTAPRMRIAI